MARKSSIKEWSESFDSFESAKAEFLRRWNLGGTERESIVLECGYEGEGACYNAARTIGFIAGGPPRQGNGNGNGERKRTFKGVLPVKAALAVCKALGLDADEFETIDYNLYCQALGEQGDAWRDFIFTRLGGIDSEGGKAFKAWIDYHVHAELEEQRRRERDADPTFRLKVKLADAQKRIEDLELRIAELTCDLRSAASSSQRRFNGGTLTSEMKKLMQQRFHPDKQNGNDEELYTSITQWINALETVN